MEFMVKFGHMFVTGQGVPLHLHPPTNHPRHITLRKAEDRHAQMQEEVDEFYEAMQAGDIALMADSLVDLVYFAKGTANLMGLPWEALWVDVHRANMAKERGEKVRGGRAIKVDAVKPPGWEGPKTMQVLRSAGYDSALHGGAEWDDPENLDGGQFAAKASTSRATTTGPTSDAPAVAPSVEKATQET
jgi:predicted HAD superfamily Cof-like phosphohydrolase